MTQEDKKEQFRISLETRNFEIELFWKRSLFFWGLIAAAFIAFANLYAKDSNLSIVVANFGLICSIAWTLANRGSKFWQENWEQKVDKLEGDVIGKLFTKIEPVQKKKFIFRARRYSVSKLAIGLSDYVTFLWFGIILFLTGKQYGISVPFLTEQDLGLIFSICTLLYCGLLFYFARSDLQV